MRLQIADFLIMLEALFLRQFRKRRIMGQEKSLLVSSKKQFKEYFDIDVKTNHEVVKINRKEKTVVVKDLVNNKMQARREYKMQF